MQEPPGTGADVEHHAAGRDERIAALQASLSVLEHAMGCDAEDIARCPDFQAKVTARIPD
ncbi:hypothetical protein ACQPYE_19270 [Actinosynnema sp. CA-299493]